MCTQQLLQKHTYAVKLKKKKKKTQHRRFWLFNDGASLVSFDLQ